MGNRQTADGSDYFKPTSYYGSARVIHAHQSRGDNELTITKGEIITLQGGAGGGWICAETEDGKKGYIPDGYFQIIETTGDSDKIAESNSKCDIEGENEGEVKDIDDKSDIEEIKPDNNDTDSLDMEQLQKENMRLKQEKSMFEDKIIKEHDTLKTQIEKMQKELDALKDEKESYENTITEMKQKINSLNIKVSNNPNYNQYETWKSKDVLNWILSIEDGLFMQYQEKLTAEILNGCIEGKDLSKINMSDIKDLGVSKFADRKTLESHIKKLTNQYSNEPKEKSGEIYEADKQQENKPDDYTTPYI